MVFGLAPLEVRRQIAMLGLIHRCVLGLGPSHFQKFFRPCSGQPQPYETRAVVRRHPRQLVDIRDGKFLEIQRRSALGMIWIYNRLPEEAVSGKTVSCFQRMVQDIVKERILEGCIDWRETLSPRVSVACHILR